MEKDQKVLTGLDKMRDNAFKIRELCETKNWEGLFDSLNREQVLRKKYFPGWQTPAVSSVIDYVWEKGAQALKLCGAGGGGCLIVLAKNKKHKQTFKNSCIQKKIPIIYK